MRQKHPLFKIIESGFASAGRWKSNTDLNFNKDYAWNSTSNGASLIASDMVGIGENPNSTQNLGPGVAVTGWELKSNHTDGSAHKIMNQFVGPFGTPQLIQGCGGNFLYNDGHVIWKHMDGSAKKQATLSTGVQIRYWLKDNRNGGNAGTQSLQVLVDGTDISSGGFDSGFVITSAFDISAFGILNRKRL